MHRLYIESTVIIALLTVILALLTVILALLMVIQALLTVMLARLTVTLVLLSVFLFSHISLNMHKDKLGLTETPILDTKLV